MAPFPYVAMLAIMASLVSSMVVQMSVFAYAGYMVEHLGVVDDKDESGYYAGVLSSSFMIGRLCSSHFWGLVADRLGRRFVLVFGIVSTAICSVLFGCSTTFAVAFTFRFLLGLLNGVMVVSRTLVSEVCGSEHETIGMGVVTTSWTVGGILGPGVGGLLAEPARHHPAIFSQLGLFGRFPYLLPNLVGAGLSLIALPLVLCSLKDPQLAASSINPTPKARPWQSSWCCLGGSSVADCDCDERSGNDGGKTNVCGVPAEYAPVHESESPQTLEDSDTRKPSRKQEEVLPTVMPPSDKKHASNKYSAVLGQEENNIKPKSLLAQGHIRVLLLMNGIYACIYSGFDEVYPLWALTSAAKGGLDWSTPQIGKVFFSCGLTVLALETLVVPYVTPRLGVKTSQTIGSMVEIPVYILLPMLSRVANNDGLPIFFTSVTLLVTCYAGSNAFFVGLALATNNAAGSRRRGELNGVSVTIESLARAISPIACSTLFALSIDGNRSYPFERHFVFYLLACTRLAVACLAWRYAADNETME